MWNQETNFPDTTSNLYILSLRSIFPYDWCSNFWWDILKNRPQVILSLLLSCIRLLQKIKRDKSFLRGSPLSKPCIHIYTIRYIVLINIFNNSNKLSIYNIECPKIWRSINIYFLYLWISLCRATQIYQNGNHSYERELHVNFVFSNFIHEFRTEIWSNRWTPFYNTQ